jgi:integrase/recombinase XerD
MHPRGFFFDTLVDTNKIYVSMKDKFVIRVYKNADGKSPISLRLSGDYKRERILLNINVNPKEWDLKKERLIPLSKENQDVNLILDNFKSKITNIKTSYRLADPVLTPENLKKEFLNGMPRIRFTAFCDMMLEEEKVLDGNWFL